MVRAILALFFVALTVLGHAPSHALADGPLGPARRALASLPVDARQKALLAHLSPEGHWTIENHTGEKLTAATPEELTRGTALIAGGRTRLILSSATPARLGKSQLPLIEPSEGMTVMVGATGLRAIRPLPAGTIYLAYKQDVFVALDTVPDLARIDRLLGRTLRSPPRALRLATGGPATLAASHRYEPLASDAKLATPEARRVLVDAIDPDHLTTAFTAAPRQTFLLTGKRDLTGIEVASGITANRRLDVEAISKAAVASDTTIVIVSSPSAAQPETRSWLIKPTEIAGWRRALGRHNGGTVLDLITALMASDDSQRGPVAVTFDREADDGRQRIAVTPFAGDTKPSLPDRVSRTVTDLGRRLVGQPPALGLEIFLPPEARLAELDQRWVASVPSRVQWIVAVLFGLGLLGFGPAWRWFAALWPTEIEASYGNRKGFMAARIARLVAFVVVFLPIVGAIAAVATVVAQLRGRGTSKRAVVASDQ